jgi:hypothetical protein
MTGSAGRELRRWRKAARPHDAVAVAEHVRWIDAQATSPWNLVFLLLAGGDRPRRAAAARHDQGAPSL